MEFSFIRHVDTKKYLSEVPDSVGTLTWKDTQDEALLFRVQVDQSKEATITTVYGGDRWITFSGEPKDEELGFKLSPFVILHEFDGQQIPLQDRYTLQVLSTVAEEKNFSIFRVSLRYFLDVKKTIPLTFLNLRDGEVELIPLQRQTPDYTSETWMSLERFNPNSQSECQLLVSGLLLRDEELYVTTFVGSDCGGGGREMLLPGKHRGLNLKVFSSLFVPENMRVTFYQQEDAPEGGPSTSYGPGIYIITQGTRYLSAIVTRILAFDLYQASMCGGYARDQTKMGGFRPQSVACDQAVGRLCQVSSNQISLCNCIREQADLEATFQELGLGDLVDNMPVKCFGKDCFVTGYITEKMKETTCSDTICIQSQRLVGEDITALGTTQNLVCNGKDFYSNGSLVNPTIPKDAVPAAVPVETKGTSTVTAVIIASSAVVLVFVGIIIFWLLTRKRR